MSLNWFISVDDHLIEPARLWQERVPERMRSEAPHIVRDGDSEFWVYEDRQIVTTGLNAVAGKKREEFSPEPITYEDMRPGCYEPAARVADMDQGNVLSSMMFPSFPRYCGQVFHEAKDRDLAGECVRAWNDFVLEEFAGAFPGRFIPMMLIPLWDPAAAVAEIERTMALGRQVDRVLGEPDQARAALDPHRLLGPRVRGGERDRRRALDARGVVVQPDPHVRRHADAGVHGVLGGGEPGGHAARLVVQRQVRAVPELKIALSEGSIGWIPYFLERAEQVVDKQRFWASRFDIDMNPSHERGEAKGTRASRSTPTSAGCSRTTSSARSSRTRPASGCSTSSARTT